MHVKRLNVSSFELRSLALFASMALGGGYASAQFTLGPSGPPGKTAAAPSTETIPANRWSATQIADAFRKTDSDANGSISRKEAEKSNGLARNFEKVDANGDGALSRQEFEQSLK